MSTWLSKSQLSSLRWPRKPLGMTNNNSVHRSFDFVKWDIWTGRKEEWRTPAKIQRTTDHIKTKRRNNVLDLLQITEFETQSKWVTKRLAAPEYESTLVVFYYSTLSDLPIFSIITLCLGNHFKVTHLYFSSVLCESFPYLTAWRTGRLFPISETPWTSFFKILPTVYSQTGNKKWSTPPSLSPVK